MRQGIGASAIIAVVVCLGGSPDARAVDSSVAPEPSEVVAARVLGARVIALHGRARRSLALEPRTRGVLVEGILYRGAAAQAGVRKGDVLTSVDATPVPTLCAFGTTLSARAGSREIRLSIRRMGETVFVRLKPSADSGAVPRAACEDGETLGCLLAGLILERTPDGTAEALRLFEQACDDGLADACSAAGEAHLRGRGTSRDPSRSIALFRRACEDGSASGCTSEAFQHATGTGVPRDDERATPIFERGCDLGNPSGCYNLGLMLEKGRGVTPNLARARAAYEKGCSGGDVLACTNLGFLHERGLGGPADDREAAKLYSLGCESDGCVPGDPIACSNLAVFYRRGRGGLDPDTRRSAELFRRACDRGQGVACGELGAMTSNGDGVRRDETRAAVLHEKGCSLGYVVACANLASALLHGIGIAPDAERAAELFRHACDAGDAVSCDDLRRMDARRRRE